jgi:acetyltransferase-like isoleucine patch superfamily enzyme
LIGSALRKDHRPYWLKRCQAAWERTWVNHFIRPQLDTLGHAPVIMKPWYLKLHGSRIGFGAGVHVITSRDRTVRLTTWTTETHAGRIQIGNYALLCPGVRIDSAVSVHIGDNCMLAAGVYVTDADWHDIYDRTQPVGGCGDVVLQNNVWIGDGSIVCKQVEIGTNTVVGAGSVVTRSLPANVIAAGNPARVIRQLDPGRPLSTRATLLADHVGLQERLDRLERQVRRDNSAWQWLRSLVAPGMRD